MKYYQNRFGGKVFSVFSFDGEIANKEIVTEIQKEIARLKMPCDTTSGSMYLFAEKIIDKKE